MSVKMRLLLYWLLQGHLLLQRASGTDSNLTLPLPPDWDAYCPYTDYCNHKATLAVNLTTRQKPCCEPCSCAPDCGLKRNCCTYSMDKYRLDEQEHITCTLLSTVNTIGGIRFTNYYLTVDKCADRTSCYDFKSAPWGSMYPVASRVSGMIYLNDKCAECNGELDIQKLEIEVNCLMISSPQAFVSDGVKSAFVAQEDKTNAGCFIRFLPSSADVMPMKCTPLSRINRCRFDTSSVEIETLCRSFNATFWHDTDAQYANVYCRLCSRAPYEKQDLAQICLLLDDDRTSHVPFSFILNTGDVFDLEEQERAITVDNTKGLSCAHDELMEQNTRKCRKFHCPEGQMMVGGGCSFLSAEWNAGPFVAYVRLEPATPKDRFPFSRMHKLSSHRGKFFKTTLSEWWRKLFYREVSENDTYVPYFVLVLLFKKATIPPQTFINTFKQSLKIVWKLRLSGKTYNFMVSMHNYTRYYHGNQMSTTITPMLVDPTPEEMKTKEVLVSVKPTAFPRFMMHITFTKAFLCKQVDLLPEEFIDRGTSLFLKVTNRSLGLAEYWKSAAGRDRNETVSVCVDDLGPNFWYHASTAATCLIVQAFRVTLLASVLAVILGE